MPYYFAFGSNMLRVRLERRVGPVVDLGWATLVDHAHAFDKRGHCGTGKGNIDQAGGALVHGVLYRLDDRQLAALDGFEYGYRRLELPVLCRADEVSCAAATYVALERVAGLLPSDEYWDYYERGMREHDLPEEYRRLLARQAGRG
jgi:gamma-glutamylcyclotransferase